jgi:hypothetical protein
MLNWHFTSPRFFVEGTQHFRFGLCFLHRVELHSPLLLGAVFDANLYPRKRSFTCAYDKLSQNASKHGQTPARFIYVLTGEFF